jgi:hypothetical protein
MSPETAAFIAPIATSQCQAERIKVLEARCDALAATVRDLRFGASMQLDAGLPMGGSFESYCKEVVRVCIEGLVAAGLKAFGGRR